MSSTTEDRPYIYKNLYGKSIIVFEPSIAGNTKLKESYTINLNKDEDGRIIAKCPNIQGVVTDGENEDEAIKNAIEAIDAILEMDGQYYKEYNINIRQIERV